jgi:hypothetical protein
MADKQQYLQALKWFGHACELLGVFLLSVEAIKLRNFRRLNERFFKPQLRFLNPTIQVVHDMSRRPLRLDSFGVFLILITGFGFLLFIVISHLFPASATVVRPWHWSVPWWGMILLLPCYLIGCHLAGGIVYTAAVGVLTLLTKLLDSLERSTEEGTVGLIGFSLFLLYFILKTILH